MWGGGGESVSGHHDKFVRMALLLLTDRLEQIRIRGFGEMTLFKKKICKATAVSLFYQQ